MLASGVTLYFIRHGETDWNACGRYQGQIDIPLNAKGRGQAARNGETLGGILKNTAGTLDFVSSPLLRTTQTMQIARQAMGLDPLDYRTDDRLQEIAYGHWEGELWSELPVKDAEGFEARRRDTWGWQPRGGESYRMLSERVSGWLVGVSRDTVVVSHGGVSRAMRGLALGLTPATIPFLEVPQDQVLVIRDGAMSWR